MTKDRDADNGAGAKAGGAAWERRSYVTRGLAELVPGLTRAAYRKRSPAGALLMSEWAAIVGPRLAAQTQPKRLSGTQLTIACNGPMATELQHLSATLIERINVHAGRAMVERLRFVQDVLAAPPPVTRPRQRPNVRTVEGIEPGDLQEALGRLLAAIRDR